MTSNTLPTGVYPSLGPAAAVWLGGNTYPGYHLGTATCPAQALPYRQTLSPVSSLLFYLGEGTGSSLWWAMVMQLEGSGPVAKLAALVVITANDTGVVTAGISNVGSEVHKCGGGKIPSPVGGRLNRPCERAHH